MTSRSLPLSFLQIQSQDPELVQKGRLLQGLVFLLVSMSLLRFMMSVPGILLAADVTFGESIPYIMQFGATLVFWAICYYFIHHGRVIEAAHLFAIILIITFFLLLVTEYQGETSLPYLMLIPVVAVAVLDGIRPSMLYALVTTALIGYYTAVAPPYTTLDFAFFSLVMVGVSVTVWTTARSLQKAAERATLLAAESQQKSAQMQQRAQQLRHSVQIGQLTSGSLDLTTVLQEAANLILTQFNLYHVSIFLFDEADQVLTLAEAAGSAAVQQAKARYRFSLDDQSIIGWVAMNRTFRVVPDVVSAPQYQPDPLLPHTRAEVAFPLVAREQLLGVLDVQSSQEEPIETEVVTILQILANQLAANLKNAQLFNQTEAALHETRTLYEFNSLLANTLDVGEIYRRAVRTLAVELNARRCLIFAYDAEANAIQGQIGYEYRTGVKKQAGFFWHTAVYEPAAYPHLEKTLQSKQTAVYHRDPNQTGAEQSILTSYQATSYLEVPLLRGDALLGLIWFFRDEEQPPFLAAEINLIETMATQTAVALTNAQLASDAQVRVAQLSTINRMSIILSHAPSLKAIFEGARREIMALIPATGMSIMLLTKEGDKINWLYGFEFGHEVDLSNIPPLPITQGFSGHVVRTREMLYVGKKDWELRQKFQSIVVGEELATWLGLPMIVSGELIGVLAVENEDEFSEREIELLKTIVGPLASAIYNFIQLDELQVALEAQSNQRIQLQTAAEVASAATSVLNLEKLVQESVNLIKERFTLYYVGLFLVDYESSQAVLVAGTGEAGRQQVKEGRRLPVGGRSLIGGATGDGKPRITQDVQQDVEWLPNPHLPHTRSELALPLRVRGQVIGALTAQSVTPHLFTDELIQVLQTLCDQLATSIENARLLTRVEARAKRQQTLTQLSAQLHRTSDVEEIINIGLRAISTHLDGSPIKVTLGHGAKARLEPEQEDNGRAATPG